MGGASSKGKDKKQLQPEPEPKQQRQVGGGGGAGGEPPLCQHCRPISAKAFRKTLRR